MSEEMRHLRRRIVAIPTQETEIMGILLTPERPGCRAGLLWIHGGGYAAGMPSMLYVSMGRKIAKKFGAVVLSPGYRLSGEAPYPAALNDCYAALKWMDSRKEELGIDRIMVGGESAGGGLTAALCMLAHDRGEVNISYQFPLYPMLDCEDTESSRNNRGFFWNTRRNHAAWKMYLKGVDPVPAYASPARREDYRGLPPCYTFVLKGEPFYAETLRYVRNLQEAGVEAAADVYPGKTHGFDLMMPCAPKSLKAHAVLMDHFRQALEQDAAPPGRFPADRT